MTSGGAYGGEPIIPAHFLTGLDRSCGSVWYQSEIPKSVSLHTPSGDSSTFSGFKSRWAMP